MTTINTAPVKPRFMRGGRWLALPIAVGLVPLTGILVHLIQASLESGELNAVLLPVLVMWWPPVLTAWWWWRHPDASGGLGWHLLQGFATLGYTLLATALSFLVLSLVVG